MALKNKDEETASGITKLSHLMRYMLSEVEENEILLEKEISYFRNYIDLQKLRFSEEDDIEINMHILGNPSGIKVPPFLFIVFIENAFKYGLIFKNHSFIHIQFDIADQLLQFQITNSVHKKTDIQKLGIGLANIHERLELLFPGNYQLDILEENNTFKVNLNFNPGL